MADEPILDAIARLRVDDGNAVEEIASVVEAIKGELTKLANTRGISIGEDVVKGIGPATNQIGELLFQLQKIVGLGPQLESALSAGKFGKGPEQNLRALIQGTEQLLALTRQVEAAQNQTAKGPVQGPVVAERERLRGPNGRFISQPEADRLAADAAENARRQAAAASPGPMVNSTGIGGAAGVGGLGRLETEISEIEQRIKNADPGPADQYERLNVLRARFVAAEEGFIDAQIAQNEQKEGADKKYASAYATLQQAGLNLLKELNALREQTVDAERKAAAEAEKAAQAHGVQQPARPRTPGQLDELIRGTAPIPEAAAVDKLQAAVAEQVIALRRATAALDKTDGSQEQIDRAEQNYIAARKRLSAATEQLLNAERKLTAAQEEQASAAATAGSPRRAMLTMNSEDFLKARGIAGDESLRSQQLALQLQEVKAQTAVIAGRAQENLTQTEMNKLLAEKTRLASRELGLQRQITEAKAREAREARGDGGFLGGVFGKNREDDGFGQGMGFQAGITFKYFALYSAFSAGQRILEGILETTREYTAATNQLGIALGQTQDQAEQTAQSYSDIGKSFGINPLQATTSAVKFIRSFRDQQGNATAGSGEAGARIGGIVLTLEPDEHAQQTIQSLIGVAKAYELGAAAAEDAYDKMLQVAQQYGYQSAGEVAPGVAAVADIGRQSGYDIPQLTALIASVMQQTGVGSDAAAGDVKRFLGSQNEPGMTRLFQSFGIDVGKTLYEKLKELNDITKNGPAADRNNALLGLGSPRTAAAVSAALAGISQSEVAAAKAEDPNRLTAADQAQKQLQTFAGQLQAFSSEVKGLFVQIAQSGLLDVLGLGVKSLEALVRASTELLSLWNLMPAPIRDVIGAFIALAAIARAQAFFRGSGAAAEGAGALATRFGLSGTSFFAGAAGGAAGSAAGAAAGTAVTGVTRGLALAAGEAVPALASTTAATTGWVGSLKAAALGVRGLVASMLPLATVIAGVMLVLDAKDSSDKQQQAGTNIATGHQNLHKALAAGDLEGANSALEQIKQARKETEEASDTIGGKALDLTNVITGVTDARMDLYKKSDADIQRALAEMAAIEAKRKELNDQSPVAEWFGKNYTQITSGVDTLANKGAGPSTVIAAIDDVIRKAPSAIRGAFVQPGDGQKGLPDLVALAMQALQRTGSPTTQRQGYQDLHSVLTNAMQVARSGGDDIQMEAIRQQIDQVDKAWSTSVVQQTQSRIDILKRHYTGFSESSKIKSVLTDAMNQVAQTGDVQALVQLMNMADAGFLHEYLIGINAQKNALAAQAQTLAAAAEAARAAAPAGDKGDIRGEQRYRQSLPNVAAANSAYNAFADGVAKTAREAATLADPQGDATTKLSSALAQARAKFKATTGDPVSQAKAEVEAARLAVGDTVKNTAEWFNAMKALNDAIYQQSQAQLAVSVAKINSGAVAGNAESAARVALTAAQTQLAAAIPGTADYYTALKGVHDAERGLAEYLHQSSAAARAASIIPGDPLSQAKADLAQAKADLRFAGDSQSYYTALKSLREAQYQLGVLELERLHNTRLLSIDITDPVAQAREQAAQAARQLQFDKGRGAGSDVLLADEVALRQARSDASGAAWSQQFQDYQTNYNLNRISLSAYLSYLRSQHDYLSAVKDKTRQQVDQLNQVDQALKSLTDSMQGQWNLGDIKVPTPYEMRRMIGAGAGGGQTTNTYINFYGSAEAEMTAALTKVLGQPVLQSASTAPPRV